MLGTQHFIEVDLAIGLQASIGIAKLPRCSSKTIGLPHATMSPDQPAAPTRWQ